MLALITGAASGIGRAVALELAQQGYDLALWDLDTDGLSQTAPCLRHKLSTTLHSVDVSDPLAVKAAISTLHAQGQEITHLAACAGIFRPDVVLEGSGPAEEVMKTNYYSVVHTLRAVAQDLVKHRGAAVLTGSTESHRAQAQMASYVARSKPAVLGYGRSAAVELASRGGEGECCLSREYEDGDAGGGGDVEGDAGGGQGLG